jgi:arsenate reductase-like glutaredoxin family protein
MESLFKYNSISYSFEEFEKMEFDKSKLEDFVSKFELEELADNFELEDFVNSFS